MVGSVGLCGVQVDFLLESDKKDEKAGEARAGVYHSGADGATYFWGDAPGENVADWPVAHHEEARDVDKCLQ